MLDSLFKYLNNVSFFENVDLRDLQNCVEVAGKLKPLLYFS